jgi:hypothetical protein
MQEKMLVLVVLVAGAGDAASGRGGSSGFFSRGGRSGIGRGPLGVLLDVAALDELTLGPNRFCIHFPFSS